MPTSYTDQFLTLDPYNPPPFGTALNFSVFTLIDQNDDDGFDRFNNDSIDGVDITSSWPGDTVTINVPGVGNITYSGTTFYLSDGRQVFTPTDGQALQNGTLVNANGVTTQGPLDIVNLGSACFTPGTLIETERGERLIEDLRPGDLVMTRDNGLQPVLWIGRQTIRAEADFAPILFAKGALNNTAPLLVSPQQRMLIEDWRAAYFCGCSEVFVSAKHLVNGTTVTQVPGGMVDYMHLLFADHQVIYSHGIPSESYFPGLAGGHTDCASQAELATLFPRLASLKSGMGQTAHPVSQPREARMMALSA